MTKQPWYRWVIVVTCFQLFFVTLGLGNLPNNLYIVPVSQHFGFSRGDFSLIFTFINIAVALVQLSYAALVRRFGVRVLLSAGALLFPLGHLVNSFAVTLPAFYAGATLTGFSLGLVSITSVAILVNNWFDQNQGTVLGMVAAASGWGGSLFSIIVGQEIARSGFQATYLYTAIALVFAALPAVFLLRSQPPVPPGPAPARPGRGSPLPPEPLDTSQPQKNLLKTPAGLMAAVAIFLFGFTINPIWANTPAVLVEKGYSPVFAASIYSGILLVMGVAKIVLGYINDRLGSRASVLLALGAFVLATVILLLAQSEWQIWVFMFLDGIAMTCMTIIIPLYAMGVLGRQNFSHYLGFYVAILQIGISLSTSAMNYAYDLTGTYSGSIVTGIILGIIILALANASFQKAGEGRA